jgi:hypothetical protein
MQALIQQPTALAFAASLLAAMLYGVSAIAARGGLVAVNAAAAPHYIVGASLQGTTGASLTRAPRPDQPSSICWSGKSHVGSCRTTVELTSRKETP